MHVGYNRSFRGCSGYFSYFVCQEVEIIHFLRARREEGGTNSRSIRFHLSLSRFHQGNPNNPVLMGPHPRQWTTTVHSPAWLDDQHVTLLTTHHILPAKHVLLPLSMDIYGSIPLKSTVIESRLASHSLSNSRVVKASHTFMTEGDIPVP